MAEGSPPDLSVIIPSVNGWRDLDGAVAALRSQNGGPVVEIVVVDRLGAAVREPLSRKYPDVRIVTTTLDTTIPVMRQLGFAAATAPVIGVIEDHVIVPPTWASEMLAEHRAGAQAVGGSVVNAADKRLIDRAAFLCEYSHCLIPPDGDVEWLTGNNVTYRRDLLDRFRDTIALGRWENVLHDAFRSAGVPLLGRSSIRVGHKKHYTVGEYTSQRYLYARAYAGMRVENEPFMKRLAYGLAAFALPPMLLYRIVSRSASGGVPRSEIIRSLPLLFLFVCAWALGEVAGYWFGAGNTLAKVC